MVRFVTMKRIAQIIVSIIFIVGILTVYFAFDYAINRAIQKQIATRRALTQDRHNKSERPATDVDEDPFAKGRSVLLSTLAHSRKPYSTIRSRNDDNRLRPGTKLNVQHVRPKNAPTHRPKAGHFPKARTGIKVNKPKNAVKNKRKRLPTTTSTGRQRDKNFFKDKRQP